MAARRTARATPPPATHFYTVAEIAALFRIHERTVYTWVAQGKLTATRAGNRFLRFTDADIELFRARNQTEAA
jgi:excisionase family DNA binding protein